MLIQILDTDDAHETDCQVWKIRAIRAIRAIRV